MLKRIAIILWLVFWALVVPSLLKAQAPWNGYIASTRAIDWRSAGVPGGIPHRTTICATETPVGTIGTPVAPTTINADIMACTNGVVQLSDGDYYLNANLSFNSSGPHDNVTLRCTNGPTKCHLHFSNGEVHMAAWSGSGGNANWTAGYAQGATTITLDNVTGLTVNQSPIFLRQCDDGYSGNPCVAGASGGPLDNGQVFTCTNDANHCANQGTGGGNSQVQVVLATAITGAGPFTVTIDRPLYASNWNAGQNPTATWITRPVTGIGVEDVDVQATGTNNPLGMNTCYACWVKGSRLIGGNTKIMDVFFSPRSSIVNNYVTSNIGSALAYPISLDNSGDDLVQNNITTYAGGIIIDEPESGDVIDYNYARDYWGQLNNGYIQNWYDDHAAGSQFFLMEGNQYGMVNLDAIHGTHAFYTLFRNQFTTTDGPYVPTTNTNTSAMFIRWGVRYANILDNVLGSPSFNNQYECIAPACSTTNQTIYTFGTSAGPPFNDPLVKATSYRWNNYDTVNNSVQRNTAEVPSALNAGAGFTLALAGSGTGPWTGTIPNTPCINQLNVVHGSVSTAYGYDTTSAAGSGLTGSIAGVGISSGSVNCTTGTVTVTFTASQTSAEINYVQQTASASIYRNALPVNNNTPNSFYLTATSSTHGGTGIPWWKVCTNYPTCSTFQTNPFPAAGHDVSGGNGAGGFAFDIPAAIAWQTLPVDTTLQNSYTVTNASWSAGVVTLTVSGMGSNRFIGEFTLTGMNPSGYNGTYQMIGSSLTQVTYALAGNPGAFVSGGTMLFPNHRQFDESVYQNDPVNGTGGGGKVLGPVKITGAIVQ